MKGSKKNEPKSKNYIKQLRKTNKLHRHIANQRNDNLHKLSTEIANQYDIVCVEDLNMTAIGNKGFRNGKATYDNGYGMLLSERKYICACGLEIDRDLNAAINIKNEGLRLLA